MPRGSKPKIYPADLVARVNELYGDGMTQCEVAEELGVAQKVVWNLMRRHDIPRRPAIKRDQRGENNSSWKGSDAKYAAFHRRVQSLRGKPQKCEVCGSTDKRKSYDWASMTKRYDDPRDYKRMCRSCHFTHDGIVNNIKKMRKRGANA